MSHFKVLVIGDDFDLQLAPYDENIKKDPYKEDDFDDLDSVKSALAWDRDENNSNKQGLTDPGDDLDARLEMLSDYCGGDLRINRETGHIERWTTYNPLSKWDFYSVGGRYNTTFKIKADADEDDYLASQPHWSESFGNQADHENSSDQARKRAIDFMAMVDAALDDAAREWEKLTDATEGITPPTRSWMETLEAYGVDTESRVRSEETMKAIDEAREEWSNHPWNAAARRAMYWDAYERFHMGEEDPEAAYRAERAAMAVGGFYAVVQDGNWTARGDMGWFGMSSDTIEKSTWVEQTAELIRNLPDDTWLTVVDCHI